MSRYRIGLFSSLIAALIAAPFAGCSQTNTPPDAGIDVGADASTDTTDIGADVVIATCGDEAVDAPYEQCEPSIDFTCADAGFAYGVAACRPNCTADTSGCSAVPICGDASVDVGEDCDDGNLVDGDGCNADCGVEVCGDGDVNGVEVCDGDRTVACADGTLGVAMCGDDCEPAGDTCLNDGVCGDGTLDVGESCDDGNAVSGDGCSDLCAAEACGDGVRQPQEQCDANEFGSATCRELGFDLGTLYCTDACRFDTERCAIAVCGDGLVQGDEVCDDGNRISGDGCSRRCVEETCGDGRMARGIGEQCDGLDVGGLTCANFGYALAPLSCTDACHVDLSDCVTLPRCGDGVVDGALGETCDDGNASNNDGCSAGCVTESCGDGVIQSDELCEPSIRPDDSCVELGYVAGRPTCSSTCEVDETTCIAPGCGNGILDDGELCDGLLSAAVCLDEGYDFGRVDCTEICELDLARCRNVAVCGDGVMAGTEECDDGNRIDGDGCAFDCIAEYCGDGIVQPSIGETCDGGRFVARGCGSDGAGVSVVDCADSCSVNIQCFDGVCGNGVLEVGEACDDGGRTRGDGCDHLCRSETCNDGTVQAYEACDGDVGSATCDDIGVIGGSVSCSACAIDYSACGDTDGVCGDGVVDGAEQCDSGALNSDLPDLCRTDCTLPRCGDGIVDFDETCDDPTGVTCNEFCVENVVVVIDLSEFIAAVEDPTVTTILIVEGEFEVPNELSIDRALTVRGLGEGATLFVPGAAGDLFVVSGGTSLTLENLIISPAPAQWAILTDGDLTLINVHITPESDASCVRQTSTGILSVSDSSFENCTRDDGGPGVTLHGGAIDSSASSVTIVRTTFLNTIVGNTTFAYGGAIGLHPSLQYIVELTDVRIEGAQVVSNGTSSSLAGGGGIDIRPESAAASPGIVSVDNLQIVSSSVRAESETAVPGSIANGGAFNVELPGGQLTLTIDNSRFENNTVTASGAVAHAVGGGAISVMALNGSTADVTIRDFIATGNDAVGNVGLAKGGAFFFESSDLGSSIDVVMEHGLVADNSATASGNNRAFGGGLCAASGPTSIGDLHLTNVTIVGNQAHEGGGMYLFDANVVDGSLIMSGAHLTIAENSVSDAYPGIGSEAFLTLHASVVVENTGAAEECNNSGNSTFYDTTSTIAADACLGDDPSNLTYDETLTLLPLANNGSVSRTMLPVLDGSAHNLADTCIDAYGMPLTTDQRGLPRADGLCDAGAAERQP